MRTRAALLLVAAVAFCAGGVTAQTPKWVSAYYAGWQANILPPNQIDFDAITHLVHFALYPTGGANFSGSLNNITSGGDHVRQTVAAAHAAGKKVIITVGGWNTGDGFNTAANSTNRATAVANLVRFMVDNDYDGIDIDWEPIGNSQNYVPFIRDLRAAMTAANPNSLLLTAVMGQDWSRADEAAEYFDQINIMTYDISGNWGGWVVWHNAPIYNGGHTFPSTGGQLPCANTMVDDFVRAGSPLAKLGIGIDFYGYEWRGVHSPEQAVSTVTGITGNIPYSTIAATYPGEQLWDANAQAAYISVDLDGTNNDRFISIDNEQTIFAKMKYLHDKGVGGLIIWELGGGYRTNAPAGQKDLLLQAVKAAYTGGEPPLEDTTPPVVSLIFPTPGASLNNSVWLEANATDNVRIASVAFTLNGTPVGAPVEFTPYRMKMNTWTYTNGQYELAATAKDLAGNTATATVTVTINNQGTPPVPVEKVVYDNQLRNPFMNTSWGSTIDFSNTSVSKDGSNVIRVAYGNGGGLDFLSGTWANMINIDPQTYDTLKFDVYSSSEFPLEVGFYVSASTNVTPPANQWRTFAMAIPRVPFARFYFRNATAQNRTVYFDNIQFEGPGVQTSVDPPIGGIPADFSLGQNYPNPFNPSTRISFTLPVSIHATLRVFDLSGKLVATLVDGELQAGVHEVEFNSSMVRIGSSSGLASGVYIYQLVAGSFQDTRKLVLMK